MAVSLDGHFSFMCSLTLTLLCSLLAPATLGAPSQAYVTDFGRLVLSRSHLVVEGRVGSVQARFRGVSIAQIVVKKRWHGYDRRESVRVMYIDDFVAPEAFTSTLDRYNVRNVKRSRQAGPLGGSDPLGLNNPGGADITGREDKRRGESIRSPHDGVGIRLRPGEDALFFLERRGSSYGLIGVVSAADSYYSVKLDRLGDITAIEAEPSMEKRFARARLFFMRGVSSADTWVRGNSARELMSLATRYPNLFRPTDAKRFAALRAKERDPIVRSALGRAVRAIDPEMGRVIEQEVEIEETERFATQVAAEEKSLKMLREPDIVAAELLRVGQAYRRGATRLFVRMLTSEDAIVRSASAQAIGLYGGPTGRAPLYKQLARERDVEVARSMIHACGLLVDPRAVPALELRLKDERLTQPALFALSRIGTGSARAAIERYRPRASPLQQSIIDSLLREEFPAGAPK
ncbi:MAG: HEAT repeat domain-containing protein [Planctomycetota bacterium]